MAESPKESTLNQEPKIFTQEEINELTQKGDLSRQWEWHEAFRDASKNMYRTTYADTIHGREVTVKQQSFLSGYGGHSYALKHDLLFANTGVYRRMVESGIDSKRDVFPCMKAGKYGGATFTKYTANEETPTYGSLPDERVQPPWAITPPIRPVPSHKTVPNMEVRKTN